MTWDCFSVKDERFSYILPRALPSEGEGDEAEEVNKLYSAMASAIEAYVRSNVSVRNYTAVCSVEVDGVACRVTVRLSARLLRDGKLTAKHRTLTDTWKGCTLLSHEVT